MTEQMGSFKQTTPNVFEKLHHAATTGKRVELSFADVTLLQEMLGDELARAEGEFATWEERLVEYFRNMER